MSITQSELAVKLGITQQAVAKYESGYLKRPSPELALKIQEFTNGDVTVMDILFPELIKEDS